MIRSQFAEQLQQRISRYDLLCHPFYLAWSAGQLTRNDLREYAADYYHHVAAFPNYLAEFFARTPDPELRRAVLSNLCDEEGIGSECGQSTRSHAELWLDFAEGMGADRGEVRRHSPLPEITALTEFFHDLAQRSSSEAALAGFYAYESQVPRVAEAKARGLRDRYGADAKTCGYFTLHETADIAHSQIWLQQLEKIANGNSSRARTALTGAESAAQKLWQALDGIEEKRVAARDVARSA